MSIKPVLEARAAAATVRALDSIQRVRRRAAAVLEEIDDITDNGAVPQVDLDEGDSVVVAVQNAIAAHK
jgi:hypothetical protein